MKPGRSFFDDEFLRDLLRFIELYVVRPPVLLLGALVTAFYNVLVGWWLEPMTTKGVRRRLEIDLQGKYPHFFGKYALVVVPLPKRARPVAGFMHVTYTLNELLINFVRGRDKEISVSIAPSHAPRDWHSFEKAVTLAGGERPEMSNFEQAFDGNFERLEKFFAKENYGPPHRQAKLIQL